MTGVRARVGAVLVVLATAAGLWAALSPSVARADCEGEDCGAPRCWSDDLRVRPDMRRTLQVRCRRARSAKVTGQPQDGSATVGEVDWVGVKIDVLADADAARTDEVVLEVMGPERTIEVRVPYTVVPTSENAPPECDGDTKTERSSGDAPVTVFLHPWCRDPDGDEFVIVGGGPGTHPDAPKQVAAGDSDSNWNYRTATSSGTERTTIWATDVLGARSADAELEVTVGPGVDRLPTCRPNPSGWAPDGVQTILSRPGATRRFAVICEDPDADPFVPRLSTPPAEGALAPVIGPPSFGFWGLEHWIDATYAPTGDGTRRDELAFTAGGAAGDGPEARMAIVPRELPANSGGGCGWSGARIVRGTAGVVTAWCSDDDGDELSVEVRKAPMHGTAGPGAVVSGLYGTQTATVPYVPDPGFTGYDCVQVRIADGNGLTFELTLDIWVEEPVAVPAPPVALPPVTVPSPPVQAPGRPVAPVVAPTEILRSSVPVAAGSAGTPPAPVAVARELLETPAVAAVARGRDLDVHAVKRLSRRELLRRGRAAGLVVSCRAGCSVRASAALRTGARVRGRISRTRSAISVPPGHAQALWLTLGAADRARLQRARRPAASFAVEVRPADGPRRTIRRTIRIGA